MQVAARKPTGAYCKAPDDPCQVQVAVFRVPGYKGTQAGARSRRFGGPKAKTDHCLVDTREPRRGVDRRRALLWDQRLWRQTQEWRPLTKRALKPSSFRPTFGGSRSDDLGHSGAPGRCRTVRHGAWLACLDRAFSMGPIRRAAVVGPISDGSLDHVGPPDVEWSFFDSIDAAEWQEDALDLVVATDLHGYRWWRWAVQEIARALRPGGWLLLMMPGRNARSRRDEGRRPAGISERLSTLRQVGLHVDLWKPYGIAGPVLDRLGCIGQCVECLLGVPAVARRWAAGHLVMCRKPDDFYGRYCRAVFDDIKQHCAAFARTHGDRLGACRGWVASHPGFEPDEPRRWDVRETAGASVLVLAPHPDDEIIGCGGTLLQYREAQAAVSVVYLTEGSGAAALADVPLDDRAAVRQREAEKVAEQMGFEEVFFWGRPDGRLACTDDVVERMGALLDHLRPTVIFVPFCTDPHPDHVGANRILVEALKRWGDPARPRPLNVLGYEVWGMVPPHVYCPIDTEIERKLRLLMLYRTGMKAEDYVRYTRDLGAYQAYTLTGRTGFVEVFARFNEAEYLRIVEPADHVPEHRTISEP